ncbi:hypothetical protein PSm6_01400 [Pseudomonas solani]|uniref:Uncharacterized protein n=1 Tax=Pseudomonas solani TaxID=2731552 RepID=A0ABN6BHK6_9PSED|nr:hypothetical protein PSm6_01400 [Pseudomonas solani]
MVEHLAALGKGDFGVAGTQFDELRGDAGEVGGDLADHGAELRRTGLLEHLQHLAHGFRFSREWIEDERAPQQYMKIRKEF